MGVQEFKIDVKIAGISDDTGAIVLPGLDSEAEPVYTREPPEHYWKCGFCWENNYEGVERCENCGHDRDYCEVETVTEEEKKMQPASTMRVETGDIDKFPYTLQDLAYWIVKRKDGVTVKYVMQGDTARIGGTTPTGRSHTVPTTIIKSTAYLSEWCNHNPTGKAVFSADDLSIWIADAAGLRNHFGVFDYVLDCGNVLNLGAGAFKGVLEGDTDLVQDLDHTILPAKRLPRILKVDWYDRCAPPLDYSFFPELVAMIKGSLVVACQGGHGRSGTSLVSLMMVLNPEYTPYAAMCHLRALHCPRAIEGKEQHKWIGELGAYLKRENDIAKVEEVKDFKKAFLALDLKSAKPYQERLLSTK